MSSSAVTSRVVWKPTEEYVGRANVTRFMKKHDIRNYEQLVRKSADDIEWFWREVCEDLGVEWFQKPERTLDVSKGKPWAKWFVGGKINVAYNCVDKHANSSRRNKVACIWEGEDGSSTKLTFWDLYVRTNQLANGLRSLGIGVGDCIGIFMPMVPETVIAVLACAKIGAIFMPLFSGFGPEAIASRLIDSSAKILLTSDGFSRRGSRIDMKRVADEALDKATSVTKAIIHRQLGGDVSIKQGRDMFLDDLVKHQPRSCESVAMGSEDPLLLAYTSGTTGKPKAAVHVHGGLLVKLMEEVAYQTDLHDEDILYWVTDIGWIMGPWEVIGGLALGGTIFLYEGAIDYPQPNRLWKMIQRHGISILGISPTAIRALMRHGDHWVSGDDIATLRILASTGEPWDPASWMWYFEKIGRSKCPIINLSGGTEVGACFLSPLPITPLKPCTLAGPSLGVAVDVVDENGASIRGSVGELVARKPWPSMTRGIWRDPERYLATYWSRWPDIWYHGDFASIDEEGFWFLHGRSDDTIKIAGKRVGPAEVESAITSHPSVSESAAIGVPDEVKGEAIVCFAVLRPQAAPSDKLRDELKHEVEKRLGKPFRPKDVKFVAELPKTRNAKILRRLIRAAYLGSSQLGDISALENPKAIQEITAAK